VYNLSCISGNIRLYLEKEAFLPFQEIALIINSPAVDNACSDGTDVAGMQKIFLINGA
jgi:hypothetical protein